MTTQRRAIMVDAGLLAEPFTAIRTVGRGLTLRPAEFPQEKGGWITLDWEHEDGVWDERTILVTRERALEAISRLEAMVVQEDEDPGI